jgi:hypothetical protein
MINKPAVVCTNTLKCGQPQPRLSQVNYCWQGQSSLPMIPLSNHFNSNTIWPIFPTFAMIFYLFFNIRQSTALINSRDVLKIFLLTREPALAHVVWPLRAIFRRRVSPSGRVSFRRSDNFLQGFRSYDDSHGTWWSRVIDIYQARTGNARSPHHHAILLLWQATTHAARSPPSLLRTVPFS